MVKEVVYYTFDENGQSESRNYAGEAYIDDEDLKELLIEFLDENISPQDIEKILHAASDENLSEEDFDRLVDEFILKNKK